MKMKNLANYLIGKDIFQTHKEYNEVFPPKNLFRKARNNIETGFLLLGRYAPLPLEIDGVRRIVDGHYITGSLEIFGAESWRMINYVNGQIKKTEISLRKIAKSVKNLNDTLDKLPKI